MFKQMCCTEGISISHAAVKLDTLKLKVSSNKLRTIGMHMQFNSGGLEALLEANSVAMAPNGAVLLTGQQLCPVTT